MSKYYFEANTKHIRRRQQYWNNTYLKNLTNIMLDINNRKEFSKHVNRLFEMQRIEDIETHYIVLKDNYTNLKDLNTFNSIINCFKSWAMIKTGEKYNIKGAYPELLSYEILKNKFPEKTIERECYIRSNSYKSLHTVDIAVRLDNDSFIACECKYSPNQIKEKDISNLINIKNNYKNANCCIITTEDKKIALKTIKNNFKKDNNINKKLKKINLIDLKEFI